MTLFCKGLDSPSDTVVPPLSLSQVLSYMSPRVHLHLVGDVAVYVLDINQPNMPTTFYSVLMSISIFIALSTVFQSINFPDNSPLSYSVLPVLFLPYWSSELNISL